MVVGSWSPNLFSNQHTIIIPVPPLLSAPQAQPFPAVSARSQLILHLCWQVTAGMRKAVATGTQGRGEGTITMGSLAWLRQYWSCSHLSGQAEGSGNCRNPINCRGIMAICTGSALPSASGVLKTQQRGCHVAALLAGCH